MSDNEPSIGATAAHGSHDLIALVNLDYVKMLHIFQRKQLTIDNVSAGD